VWLFAKDRESRAALSPGLWIAVIWVAILGSRPVSIWLGLGRSMATVDDYVEGSPLDRMVFLSLVVLALMVLAKRGLRWREVVSRNKALLLLYFYFALSSLWSDYPGVSFKRCLKDLGNVAIVMIILTEEDPLEAMKALFLMCAYLVMPLSALFIKYYPDLGRSYSVSGEQLFTGAALSKNELGSILVISGLFLFLALLDRRKGLDAAGRRKAIAPVLITLALMAWIAHRANSMTSLVCFAIGAGLLWGLRRSFLQRWVNHLGLCAAVAAGLVMAYQMFPGFVGSILQMMGRNPTLTGRTDIWNLVLAEHTNPLIGTGFYSFWLGGRVTKFWQMYSFHLNEAHNGYLETYLNNGWIGVGLILALLVSAGRKIKDSFLSGGNDAAIRLVLLIIGTLYNLTESAFNRMGLIWFALLLAVVEYPGRSSREQPMEPAEQFSSAEEETQPELHPDFSNS
jgi:O-antigen ligase